MMKKRLLFSLALVFGLGFLMNAQEFKELRVQKISSLGTPYYSLTDFGVCGAPSTGSFRVEYTYCPIYVSNQCAGGCGANPYRFTIRLYRNGAQIGYAQMQSSQAWVNWYFHNVTKAPGEYKAHVKLERRKGFLCLGGYETVTSGFTNDIDGIPTPASPNFNIDGTPPTSDGSPIEVCISNIKLHAAATTCETKYYLGVQESDRWWNRTYEYEWGAWFQGQAPNNINLQSMSSTYSQGSTFLGTDPSRMGDILFGGNLSNGRERHYRVSVCTGQPSWECKTALIRVYKNCFAPGGDDDHNVYTIIQEGGDLEFEMDKNLYIVSDAEVVEESDQRNDEAEMQDKFGNEIQVSPNPFSSYTTISLNQVIDEKVTVELFNTIGQRVKMITSFDSDIVLERDNLASGIYFYKISTNEELLKSGKLMIE